MDNTVSIQIIAAILLFFRIVSMTFIGIVLWKQWNLFKRPTLPQLILFRRVLFAIAIGIAIFNIIPIVIDALTLFVDTGRPQSLKPISIAYAFSNSIGAALSSVLIWALYKLAETRVIDITINK